MMNLGWMLKLSQTQNEAMLLLPEIRSYTLSGLHVRAHDIMDMM